MSAHNKSPTLIDKCYLGFIKVIYQSAEYVYILFLPVPRLFSVHTRLFFMKGDVNVGQERFPFGGVLWVAWVSLSRYICDNTVVCSFIFTSKDRSVKKCPLFPFFRFIQHLHPSRFEASQTVWKDQVPVTSGPPFIYCLSYLLYCFNGNSIMPKKMALIMHC